nr:MAG TPA: minor capsid protein [Caudoviricetes sp.]
MDQKNRDYWEERQIKREAKAFTTIQDIEIEYKIALEKAKQDINKEISRITTTYMNDNILNYNEALKLLKDDDYKVWKKDLHDYMKEYNKLLKTAPLDAQKLYLEIETLSAKSRISHLDSLKSQIDMELTKLIFGVEETGKNALNSVYRDTFLEVTKDLGINAIVSRDKIKAVLDRPWSGANFSERLWSNTDKLAETVKQEIVNGMIQGINLKTMSKRVSERFETAKKNDVERLLRTEVNYVLNQATLDGYKEVGIEKYEFSATLDSRTSQICSELHGEIFEIKKIAVGLNYPPMHPRCRSTTIPVIDYESLAKQGREELESGKTIENNLEVDNKSFEETSIKEKEIISYDEVLEKAKIIANEVDFSHIDNIKERVYNYTDYIIKREKLNGLPKVVTSEEFEKLSKDKVKLYRGVSDMENLKAKDMVKDFKYGKLFTGKGIYGNGTYTTLIEELARKYETKDGKVSGETMEMILVDNAKTITFTDLYNELEKSGILQRVSMKANLENYEEVIGDLGNYGMLKGYDAIMLNGSFGHEHYVILDRSKLIVKE